MKTILAGIVVFGLVLVRVLLWLPWGMREKAQHPARPGFLLVFGVVVMGTILCWFWFAMRAR